MKRFLLTIMSALLLSLPHVSHAAKHTPYCSSRIFWDDSTRRTIFAHGCYSRLIELADGRWMAVAESAGIVVAYSDDGGETWSSPVKIVANTNLTPNCAPDLVQLADGTIIVAYNPRPAKPYTAGRRFGIRCKRSADGGATWSEETKVYDASYTFGDGCWEPSLLQLPSGEVQLYFADESPFTSSDEQQISLCRSFDNGKTWTSPQRASFRAGHRDGMPSAVMLADGNTIALAFEDNGWSGVDDFIPTVATCPLSTNWNGYFADADTTHRWPAMDYTMCQRYKGGAPYLRKLPCGETIVSHQGHGNGLAAPAMITYVGNTEAKGFKAMSMPFGVENSLWNALAVTDTGTVVAIGGMQGRVDMIKGRALRQIEASFARPKVDGRHTSGEGYRYANATQMILGHNGDDAHLTADFAYDADSLYFISYVADASMHAQNNSSSDGVSLCLDTRYASDEYPVDGIFRIFFGREGAIAVYKGKTSTRHWNQTKPKGMRSVLTAAPHGYTLEAAVAWKTLGFTTAPVGKKMRTNVVLHHSLDDTSNLVTTMMPDAKSDASWSWIDFVLLP